MAKTSAGKRTATKAAPARRKRRWQLGKTGGIAPASFARAKQLGGAPVSAEAKDQAGGAFLWIEHFHGSGDAPSTTTVTSGSGKRLRNAVVNLIFWGDAWQASPGPSPSLAQVVSDAASILAGPYQVRVAQYGATAARLGTVSSRFRASTRRNQASRRRTSQSSSPMRSRTAHCPSRTRRRRTSCTLCSCRRARLLRPTSAACTRSPATRTSTSCSTSISTSGRISPGCSSAAERTSRRSSPTSSSRR